jgi:hypothetical protein
MSETSPHHVRKKLINSKDCYVTSVGKQDMATLGHAADVEDGKGTVLRLIFGATAQMPLRAITYVDSALRIAQLIPHQQLQIIHANELGTRVNPIDREVAERQSRALAGLVRFHVAGSFPGMADSLLHATDTPLCIDAFTEAAEEVVRTSPEISAKLAKKGSKHGGDAIVYASAHSAYQDTDLLELNPVLGGSPDQVTADRIISIGCDQERLFYGIRMLMRQALPQEIELVDTAQIFTSHSVPPYFVARSGEQLLESALLHGVNAALEQDRAAKNDLNHFKAVLGGQNG